LPGVTWLLRASIALNALLGLALARRLRRRVLIARGRIAPLENDFTAAGGRFGPLEPGTVVLVGYSHVEHGPWLDVLTQFRNRGISGAKIADVSAWIDDVLASRPARLVLVIGSNDVYFCESPKTSVAAATQLFEHVAATADCPVTVVSIPPLPADKRAVNALNKTLAGLCAQHGFDWVDIGPTLAAMDWTIDGLHLTPDAYRAIAPQLAEALRTSKNSPPRN
jgi:lysophospholipase L1-like esterase